ncbi:putative methyltransferase DDB_G0268948 isoform X1 [Diadema setosum]|uniref:putative methyltransferase DDB_G0268948 isoform X1 n=1 Tax=Diadema setosum TaxID=31175 RepID=UPI003B3AC5EA
MANIRLFEKVSHVDSYVKFRPTYPAELYHRILSFLNKKKPPPHGTAVDVGCGSGQSTHGIAPSFQRVIGFDISKAQIEAASKANTTSNVEFKVSPADSLPVEAGSVDLVTCAQAVHWLDFKSFCEESRRILRPRGCLAVYGYGVPWLDHQKPAIKKLLAKDFDELYFDALGSYWNERRRHIENKYADFSLPFEESERDDSLEIRVEWSLAHFIGYLRSWSAYQLCLEKDPTKETLLPEYQKKVLTALGDPEASPNDTMLQIVSPIFLLLGRKPGDTA